MAEEDGVDTATLEERAEEGEGVLDDGQMSMGLLEGDKNVTLQSLIERGMPVECEVSMGSAAVPAKGMLDPHRSGHLRVTYVVRNYVVVPLKDGDVVTGWKIRVNVRPVYVAALAEE